MKAVLLIIFALVLLSGAVYAWLSLKEKPKISCAALTPQPTILAFGDSLVAGHGAETRGGFVSMVASTTGTTIVNLGKDGDTTTAALARLPQALAHKPDVVLLLLGGNDALQKVPIETTRTNLDTFITKFRQGGSRVVLLGILGGVPWNDPYRSMFSELAHAHDVAYVPNVLSGVIGNQEFMSDAVHPNDAGYAKIAARVVPVLEQECAKHR